MKRVIVLGFIAVFWVTGPTLFGVKADTEAQQVLDRFLLRVGGIQQIRAIQNMKYRVDIEMFDSNSTVWLGRDGRLRLEEANGTTVFDGAKYWRSYYGFVSELPAEAVSDVRGLTLQSRLLSSLVDASFAPVPLTYEGRRDQHGRTYDLLRSVVTGEPDRTFYFDHETGLLDKVIELVPDEEFRQRKNIYRFADYQTVSGITSFTQWQGLCVTTGEMMPAPMRFSEVAYNLELPEDTFTRPQQSEDPGVVKDGILTGKILAFSPRGSMITNITRENLEALAIEPGDSVVVECNGKQFDFRYFPELDAGMSIVPGDLLLTFNRSPVIWVVKAFESMRDEVVAEAGGSIALHRVQSSLTLDPEAEKKE